MKVLILVDDLMWTKQVHPSMRRDLLLAESKRAENWRDFLWYAKSRGWDAIVLDPFYPGNPNLDAVAVQLSHSATAGRIGYVRFSRMTGEDLLKLSSLPFDTLLNHDTQSGPDLVAALLNFRSAGRWSALLSPLLPAMPRFAGRAVRLSLSAAPRLTAGELAQACGCSIRTLQRELSRSGLPPPRDLISWMRVLRAADVLATEKVSVERAASVAGFARSAGLRKCVRRLLGTTPAALRVIPTEVILQEMLSARCVTESARFREVAP